MRITAIQLALQNAALPTGDTLETIQDARDFYRFLSKQDPVVDNIYQLEPVTDEDFVAFMADLNDEPEETAEIIDFRSARRGLDAKAVQDFMINEEE